MVEEEPDTSGELQCWRLVARRRTSELGELLLGLIIQTKGDWVTVGLITRDAEYFRAFFQQETMLHTT